MDPQTDLILTSNSKKASMKMRGEQEEITIFNSDSESTLHEYKIGIEHIQNELIKFGLTKNQAKVFIYLGKYGSKTSPEVCSALKLPRTETYHILNVLQNIGIVVSEFSHPAKYSAMPMEKAIATMVRTAQENVDKLATTEHEITKLWNKIPFFTIENKELQSEKFQMLKGTPRIHTKMREMLFNTKNECSLFCTTKDLSRFYYSNLLESTNSLAIDFKLILSPDQGIPNFVNKIPRTKIKIIPKNNENNQCFFINDNNEVLIFLRNANYPARNIFAFWTDSKSLIESMNLLFGYAWKNSKLFYPQIVSKIGGYDYE